jgi:hypothetical protein
MKAGKLILCDTPAKILEIAGTASFEQAFISIVKGAAVWEW